MKKRKLEFFFVVEKFEIFSTFIFMQNRHRVTLVKLKTNFIFSFIVQNTQSQGGNSTIKSNNILSTLISYLTQN